MDRGEREQVKPLALYSSPSPAPSPSLHVDEDRAISGQLKLRRRRQIQCCGCITAILLILIVTILVLGFTVFNVKEPKLTMNGITLVNGTLLGNNTKITLMADISVKNPNSYSFRFRNSTTTIYYDGTAIGEGRIPAGKAKARRTVRLNVTVAILGIPSLLSDINDDRVLNISSYTRVDGKIKMFYLFNKGVVVKTNCSLDYYLNSTASLQGNICQNNVEI